MKKFTINDIIKKYNEKGYPLNEGIMEMNIWGVRNSDVNSNAFDDTVGIIWKDTNLNWQIRQYAATTDPGMYYRLNPMNSDGTAIIVPMFHKDCYKVGKHWGEEAMEQIAPMKYVRDNNKNGVLDFLYKVSGAKIFNQNGKTNIHAAGTDSKQVDKWSAGCQVIANKTSFKEFLNYIKSSVIYGHKNVFSYALFELEDFGRN